MIDFDRGLAVANNDALFPAADAPHEHRYLPAPPLVVDACTAIARKLALRHADESGAGLALAARHADERDTSLAGEIVRDRGEPLGACGFDCVPQIVGAAVAILVSSHVAAQPAAPHILTRIGLK